MSTPRRPQRRTHLDASVLPVEQALLTRAADLQEQGREKPPGSDTSLILLILAQEHRDLAEELHWH
jgi:hypothetical protein